ncbi:hypothetical protein BDP27DRAFT_1361914 [Rhodocollybia butyracea]|uniref:Uncharacterized protein n=1 Tax=Rhodocollybia butyracea TaxID=206335 RepID=A0A9P5PZH9_9AGAR|nr:hypothetical protein BDP27DRAFT_1361914 [Rhodocollybia butyracea]
MTPTEQEQIFDAAFNCYVNVIYVVVFTIASGIATLGILIAIRLLQVKTWREPKAMQLLCCIVIWLCLIGQTIIAPFVVLGQVTSTFENRIPTPIVALTLYIINNLETVLGSVTVLAGDLVICWRAWVLLPHDIFWRFVLAIIMICNIGLTIADLVFDIEVGNGIFRPVLDSVSVATSLVGPLQNNERSILGVSPPQAEKSLEIIALFSDTAQNVWLASAKHFI